MQDFTLTTYKKLLHALLASGYSFQTLEQFFEQSENKTMILKHDVDRKPSNALVIARIEKEAGIRASYYFRIVNESYDEGIIRQIAEMGHEIGYHYENLSEIRCLAPRLNALRLSFGIEQGKQRRPSTISRIHGVNKGAKKRGKNKEGLRDELFELAIEDFRLNLEKLRKLYPVKTICMHGSPLSKWDNRDLWKSYDYRDYGIIAEPYFDVDFDEVFYLTDTGRRWGGDSVSVRDKVRGQRSEVRDPQITQITRISKKGTGIRDLKLRKTSDIIEAAERGLLPDKIMINTHPQRWTDNPVEWTKELVWQNVKNVVKKWMVSRKDAKALR